MEATVELLIAEVRVLMVGSRQVTLSVAKQLDHVDLSQIEPFGRVRLGDNEQVIGRSRKDGTLVLADFNPFPPRRVPIYEGDLDPGLDSKPVVCGKYLGAAFDLRFHDKNIRLYADAVDRCGIHNPAGNEECRSWDPKGHGGRIHAAIEAWEAANALSDHAAALPLIVLAGLK